MNSLDIVFSKAVHYIFFYGEMCVKTHHEVGIPFICRSVNCQCSLTFKFAIIGINFFNYYLHQKIYNI